MTYRNGKITYKYGSGHALDKHSNQVVDGRKYNQEDLIRAHKNLFKALEQGTWYRDKYYMDRIMISYGSFIYIICLANDDTELTYLHNLFVPNRDYRKKNLNKKSKIEKG